MAAFLLLAVPATAAANPYEAFIDVDSEDDLEDLRASQQISDETYDTLIDLFLRGVDLNTAGREELYSLPNLTYSDVDAILDYRKVQGFIRDPAELATARVLTDDQLLSIAAFLIVRDPFASISQLHGFAALQTRFTVGDTLVPPLGLRTRVTFGPHITAGLVAVETRLRPGEVVYDPNRDALLVDAPAISVDIPKFYAMYDTEQFAVIAGTYRIGFGQRLTFDNSSDYTPNGLYRDDQLFRDQTLSRECNEGAGETGESPCTDDYHYVTPDFKWRESLLGVAAGAKHIPLGAGWLQLYGWGSWQPRSIYQYEIYDAASSCTDPRDDDDPACGAPDVFVRPSGGRLSPAHELQYSTLPDMYGEGVVGGNATYFAQRRSHIGVTGYVATDHWYVDDAGGEADPLRLDFQEWSSRPAGGRFGAIGLDASAGVGKFDLSTEVTQTFDTMKVTDPSSKARGGGGPAAVVRTAWTVPKKHELEVTARYLSTDFLNPFARPVAASDEFEGQRARDELGVRTRYTAKLGPLGLRTSLDLWTNPTDDIKQMVAYVRADVKASREIQWGGWLDYADKDIGAGGRGECYDQTFEFDELDEPVQCKGARIKGTGRVRWQAMRRLSLQTQVQYALQDDRKYLTSFRQDFQAWAIAAWKPTDDLRVRVRVRYLSEDVADADSLEESLWTYVDGALRVRKKDHIRARADGYVWLDDRDRTAERTPSPEIRFWLEYETKF